MKTLLNFLSILFIYSAKSQVIVIGHNQLNNAPLNQVSYQLIETSGAKPIVTLGSKSDFMIKLNFGKTYTIALTHNECITNYIEVIANTIPESKHEIKMTYELNVPFYYQKDEDINKEIFLKPSHRIIFDNISKMVDDTTYNYSFNRKIIKTVSPVVANTNTAFVEEKVMFSGKVVLHSNSKLAYNNQKISIYDKLGKLVNSTSTNRFGQFVFSSINASQISKIKIENTDAGLQNANYDLQNTARNKTIRATGGNNFIEWTLKPEDLVPFISNKFTTNIGGKLVLTSPNQKKFLDNKTVYLSNKYNTVIQKTKTNIFGSFVFENIKPDNTYYVGIDAKEVGKGERIDFLNKDDKLVGLLDTLAAGKKSMKFSSNYNTQFNDMSIAEEEMKMNVNAKLFGDNVNNPIGKLKIILLNDQYQPIDSTITDDFGAFKFKYLPFLRRFFLSADNKDNNLDIFNSILVFSNDDNLVKILSNAKGQKIIYKPLETEIAKLREIEVDDPWLDLANATKKMEKDKVISESILFESNKYDLLPQATELLDKVILVLQTNKKLNLEISAHTDSKGNDADNLKLSQMRAKTVVNYLASKGIDAERLVSIGYGEAKLLNKCGNNVNCGELEHAQNRRVEFKIIN